MVKEAEALDVEYIMNKSALLVDLSAPGDRRLSAALDLAGIGSNSVRSSPNIRLAVPSLIKALEDPDVAVRFWAIKALGNIGHATSEAIPALEALGKPETDPRLAAEARAALQKIRP
jgi:HEAT repeat protein